MGVTENLVTNFSWERLELNSSKSQRHLDPAVELRQFQHIALPLRTFHLDLFIPSFWIKEPFLPSFPLLPPLLEGGGRCDFRDGCIIPCSSELNCKKSFYWECWKHFSVCQMLLLDTRHCLGEADKWISLISWALVTELPHIELLVKICNLKLPQLWKITWFASLFLNFFPASNPNLTHHFGGRGLIANWEAKIDPCSCDTVLNQYCPEHLTITAVVCMYFK